MSHDSDGLRNVDDLLDGMRFDEREGRPGPKPVRFGCDFEWRDLARLVVRTEVPLPGGEEAESAG